MKLQHRSRSRSRSRRSRYILPRAGAGAAEKFYSEPEPEPEYFPGAGAGADADQKCCGSASLVVTVVNVCKYSKPNCSSIVTGWLSVPAPIPALAESSRPKLRLALITSYIPGAPFNQSSVTQIRIRGLLLWFPSSRISNFYDYFFFF